MYDLILKGGEVFDGTGVECFNGDVAIKDGGHCGSRTGW